MADTPARFRVPRMAPGLEEFPGLLVLYETTNPPWPVISG